MTCSRGCCPDYRTHIKGVQVGSFPTATTEKEKRWEVDMPAYKRLRQDGLQPPRIDGSYVIERSAKNEREVTMGRPLTPELHSVFDDMGT